MRALLSEALLLPLLLSACTAHVAPADIDAVTTLHGDTSHGAALYAQHCVACHGADGRKEKAQLPDLGPKQDDRAIVTALLTGPSIMPGFGRALQPQDLADLTAYVRGGMK